MSQGDKVLQLSCSANNLICYFRCRTDSSSVIAQYHALYQTSEMLNKTKTKVGKVISSSQAVIR